MHILIVTDSYPPEIRSASHLMQELAKGLVERNYRVTVVTSYPQYNLSEEYKNKIFNEYSEEDGIRIIRIKTLPHHKVNFIIRGISQLTMPYIFLKKIKKYVRKVQGSRFKVEGVEKIERVDKVDGVIVYSPPLPLAIVGAKIKEFFGAKYLLNVQDLFPQNAIDLGVLKNTILIKLFKKIEHYAYKKADIVTFHSEGNLEFVKNEYPQLEKKFKILHNWVDVKDFEKAKRTRKFREKFGIDYDKFVILFAGVIGPSQGLDFVIRVAQKVKDLENICFLIVGDGMEKNKLENMVRDLKLTNVIFKPFVSKDDYPFLVKDCDVGLVSLTSKNKTPVVPGKILGYMAAGIPILAFLNKESDGHKIIQDAHCGYSCLWGELEEAEKLIRKLYKEKDRLPEMGDNGYRFVRENFDKDKIVDEMLNLMFKVK